MVTLGPTPVCAAILEAIDHTLYGKPYPPGSTSILARVPEENLLLFRDFVATFQIFEATLGAEDTQRGPGCVMPGKPLVRTPPPPKK